MKSLKDKGFSVIASPGAQTWSRPYPDLHRAEANIDAMVSAAQQEAVPEVLLTQWGDNGSESPLRASLPTIIYFGEKAWQGNVDRAAFDKKVKAITGNEYVDFLLPVGMEQGIDPAGYKKLKDLRAHPDNAALFRYARAYVDFHRNRTLKNRTAMVNAHKKVWTEERKEEGFADLYPFTT